MNGLDLFSGIGGISLALEPWVRPIAYCENDRYAQAVLLSRMGDRSLPVAPIWDDILTLRGDHFEGKRVDIIYGGFPCQDISVAGNGVGLGGERSGLFFEIVRLVRELRPRFVFLENVPAITLRGLDRVLLELTALRYDCRWTIVSAAEVGAPHLRERWFLLGHANDYGRSPSEIARGNGENYEKEQTRANEPSKLTGTGKRWDLSRHIPECETTDSDRKRIGIQPITWEKCKNSPEPFYDGTKESLADTVCPRLSGTARIGHGSKHSKPDNDRDRNWWSTESDVCRVVNELPHRVDRIKCLGNSVVPLQARTAFERLMGL